MKTKASKAEARYLVKKWPKAIDPMACESGASPSCGPMYSKASHPEKIAYLALSSEVKQLESEIKSIPNTISPDQTRSDFWWHFGYYAFVWGLLLSVIRLERISSRPNTIAAGV